MREGQGGSAYASQESICHVAPISVTPNEAGLSLAQTVLWKILRRPEMRVFWKSLSVAFISPGILALVPASLIAQNYVYVNDNIPGGANTVSAYGVDSNGN